MRGMSSAQESSAPEDPRDPAGAAASGSGRPGAEEETLEDTRMSLGEHLDELRKRLIRGVGAIAIAFVVAWTFRAEVTSFVTQPYDWAMDRLEAHFVEEAEGLLLADPTLERGEYFETNDPADQRLRGFDKRLTGIQAAEPFLFQLKISLYAAIVFGAPVLLWQMWAFIAAGLYKREKRAVLRYFPFSVLAFAVGIGFGFYFITPYGLFYLNKAISIAEAVPSVTFKNFLSFLSTLCLAFGVVFQLPLVQTFLGSAGVLSPDAMAKYRGHFIVAAFVIAAVMTPPDPYTQAAMAVPLIVLYQVGIWSARVAIRRREAAA